VWFNFSPIFTFYFLLQQYSGAILVMEVLQSVQIFKSENGWKYPFWGPLIPKRKLFLAHGTYVRTTGLNGKRWYIKYLKLIVYILPYDTRSILR
jgi:hypothetical protein